MNILHILQILASIDKIDTTLGLEVTIDHIDTKNNTANVRFLTENQETGYYMESFHLDSDRDFSVVLSPSLTPITWGDLLEMHEGDKVILPLIVKNITWCGYPTLMAESYYNSNYHDVPKEDWEYLTKVNLD